MLFRAVSGLQMLTCFVSLAAVALSPQWLFRSKTSFALDAAGLSKRHCWFFEENFAMMQLDF
jgi:hypothetical protein